MAVMSALPARTSDMGVSVNSTGRPSANDSAALIEPVAPGTEEADERPVAKAKAERKADDRQGSLF